MKFIKRILALTLALGFIASPALLTGNTRLGGADEQLQAPVTPPIESPDVEQAPPQEQEPQPAPPPKIEYAQYLTCTGESVHIRSGAGTQFSSLGVAEKGTTYVLLEKVGNWYKTYYRGKTAYISASYGAVFSLEKQKDDKVEKTLLEGYKQMGVPYVYGAVRLHDGKGNLLKGFTAQKFDCSSLVQYMFYKGADTLLQVTTRTQVVQGEFVPKNQLQRGDCIYFTNESRQHLKGVNRIGHVAVYLGDNYILHTASDYARIEKISNARWKFYVETRRFI